jgi:hypothetical protein
MNQEELVATVHVLKWLKTPHAAEKAIAHDELAAVERVNVL